MDILIKSLSPELIDDYLYFFDHMVFTENPQWSKCYCYSFHFVGKDEEWTQENNRAAVIQMIKSGKMKGYLAYADSIPVGWCNVNNRENYQRLTRTYEVEELTGQKVGSIVCFLISPEYRRKGIARLLLNRIINDYTSKAYHFLEAYPMVNTSSNEKNYKGPLSLYEKSSFVKIKTIEDYVIMRKPLSLG